MTLDEMVRAVQQALGVQVDGRPGPQTWSAIYQRIVAAPVGVASPTGHRAVVAPAPQLAQVDARSEACIASLLPEVRPLARALVQRAAALGIRIQVISGFRSYEEQAALYAQGRTQPGPIVTKARPGQSLHNFGIAFDIGVFEGRRYLAESPGYQAVGACGIDLGLDWGGGWKTLADASHFQLRPTWAATLSERELLAGLRARRDSATPVYA